MIVKQIGFGTSYFSDSWRKFDFFIVMVSYVDIVMEYLATGALKKVQVVGQAVRVLRVLRISRLFRLLNKYKGL